MLFMSWAWSWKARCVEQVTINPCKSHKVEGSGPGALYMSLINGLRWIGCASILTLLLEGCVFFSPVEDMASRAAEMQGWQWTDDAGRNC